MAKNTLKYIKHISIIASIFMLVMFLSVSNVSAYKRLCMTKGQKIPSAQNPRYECRHDLCQVCATDNNFPTHDGFCDKIQGCNKFGEDSGNLDVTPPVLTIKSPINNHIYNSRQVLFDIESNEPASIYYIDNINGRGKWSRLIANIRAYSKSISFKDGFNNITIKGIDNNQNPVEIARWFYVDSAKPKISKTNPGKEFATGKFEVWFTEENPKFITLKYGNQLRGRKTVSLSLAQCSKDKGKHYCSVDINLGEYNNQNIDYNFKIEDIAGSFFESKPIGLKVDATAPLINNPDSMFIINGKNVNFKINITEPNLFEVDYYDNMDIRPSWKKLCTSLKNGICEKKATFSKGEHVVDIKVLDKSGNSLSRRIEFNIDY